MYVCFKHFDEMSDIYALETYLTLYLCLPFYQNINKIMYFLLGPKEFALFFVLARLVAAAEHACCIFQLHEFT